MFFFSKLGFYGGALVLISPVPGHCLNLYLFRVSEYVSQTNEPYNEKTNNVVYEQVGHKPSCTRTDG